MHKNRLSILVKSTYTRKKDLQNNKIRSKLPTNAVFIHSKKT